MICNDLGRPTGFCILGRSHSYCGSGYPASGCEALFGSTLRTIQGPNEKAFCRPGGVTEEGGQQGWEQPSRRGRGRGKRRNDFSTGG